MLTITVNDDRTITVTSDDEQAENLVVEEALEDAAPDLAALWHDVPFTDGALSIRFEPDDSIRFLQVVDGCDDLYHAQDAIEAALEGLSPHRGGGPKPGAHAG